MTFLDTLSRNRVRYRRSPGSNEVQLCCPFCGDHEFRFSVNIRSGAGHCWHASCGYKSRYAVFTVLRQLKIAADSLDTEGADAQTPPEPVVLPKDFQLLTRVYDDLDRKALNYLLRDRKISRSQIKERKIGVSYCGRYAYRVIIPVLVADQLKGIVARDFTGTQKPKYLNSKGEKYLYGFDPTADTCVLAEGVFKSLRLELAGFSSAALLGHDLTDTQFAQLKNSACRKVILFPDPDPVGRRGVANIADKLVDDWSGEVQIIWPVTKPADEMPLVDLRAVTPQPYDWGLAQQILLQK